MNIYIYIYTIVWLVTITRHVILTNITCNIEVWDISYDYGS